MNKTAKIILVIAGILTLFCACATVTLFASGVWTVGKVARWADTNTSEDSQEVARMAAEIAEFDLPAGFGSPYGMHIAGFTSVGYLSKSGHTHIYLTQLPKDAHMNVEEIIRTIQEGSGDPRSPWYGNELTTVEQYPVMIRGQESTLTIEEGKSPEGDPNRVATVTFQGKTGSQVLLMVSGPASEWDAGMLETLVASFR